jgi:hypothetical protein
LSLAVVRDLRVARAPVTAEDLAALQSDVLAGFVLARAAAGLSDGTIASDVLHLEQIRAWFGRPLWDMEPPDADAYFGKVLRDTAKGTRLSRAQALKTYFLFLRRKAEIRQMTGRVVECPIDEMNRPRGRQQARLRIPPTADQVGRLFAGWREELATCRKYPNAAAAAVTGTLSTVTARTISYLTWTMSRASKNSSARNAASETCSGCGFRHRASRSAAVFGSSPGSRLAMLPPEMPCRKTNYARHVQGACGDTPVSDRYQQDKQRD